VRVIAATNKDLEKEISVGNFREDLYYRLNVIPFYVPPLRARKADIARLATHFLEYFCSKESREIKSLDEEAMQAITNYSWPGNVRELKNLIERLVIMSPGKTITRNQLPRSIHTDRHASAKNQSSIILTSNSFRTAKEEFEKEFLIQKLDENDWNISRTAEAIEIERSNLHRKIKAYGIDLKR
jgi:two-component system nitrogen regulation response regulator NtrX